MVPLQPELGAYMEATDEQMMVGGPSHVNDLDYRC